MSNPNIVQITEENVIVRPTFDFSLFDTDDLSEGTTNVYYTNERVDDRVAALLVASSTSGIDITYDDSAGTLTMVVDTSEIEDSIEDMVNGLWGPSSEMAYETGKDRWEIMYSVYEANKENFIDNNINQPRMDREYRVDFSLVENLDSKFIMDEVKRHIFCSC